jgi:ParB family chromosome partitioning protein
MNDEVKLIEIERIRILNPRFRDKKKFEIIVQSIKNLGLKKPIQVSERSQDEGEAPGYDLVCGQGRIEAYLALGYKEIPATVVKIGKEDRLLRSLVENMARRMPTPLELINEILRLKSQNYGIREIGRKLDIDHHMVSGLLALKNAGEERLLDATLRDKVPLGVAMEIAKTNSVEMQRELLKAFEAKQLNHFSIRAVKKLMDLRRFFGKHRGRAGKQPRKTATSADSMVNAYRRQSEKQRLMVKKARVCEARLLFVVSAFTNLVADDNFETLLRAESLPTMPKSIGDKVAEQLKMKL